MNNSNKIILDLCGGTGNWSNQYKKTGYDVRLFKQVDSPIQGVLAAPPCTHLAASGARWWQQKGEVALLEALSVVDACLRIIFISKPVWWALENPVGRLRHYLGNPTLIFDPCDYGDPWTKKTLLWGTFKIPTQKRIEPTARGKIHRMPPTEDRALKRSITPPGFAKAFFEANP